MINKLLEVLNKHGYKLYEKSLRKLSDDLSVFVAVKNTDKYIGFLGSIAQTPDTDICVLAPDISVQKPSWALYELLKDYPGMAPVPCNQKASFGTGDRLGLVSAAHLQADSGYSIFPVISQQSPRELMRTNRSFKSVLLDAFVGVLETGWDKGYGADADHIKDEKYLLEGIEAGYSMYTLDVSDFLTDISGICPCGLSSRVESLSEISKALIKDLKGMTIAGYTFAENELAKSAIVYESSMDQVINFDSILKSKLKAYDLEVSIDEGSRDTTPEDHIYVAEYLHRSGLSFTSLAPKFPGEFQKGIEYMGDADELAKSMAIHGAIAKSLGGYRLSLHSGSDKFSVYPLYALTTEGNFHIKTSGTSWLEAVRLIASTDTDFFAELYKLCLDNLIESKKAYHVYITPEHFPADVPADVMAFFDLNEVRQLFHISYGVLLDTCKDRIYEALKTNEDKHYEFVSDHIKRHLALV